MSHMLSFAAQLHVVLELFSLHAHTLNRLPWFATVGSSSILGLELLAASRERDQ